MSARRGTPWIWMSTTIPPRTYYGRFVFGSVHLPHLLSLSLFLRTTILIHLQFDLSF